MQLFSVLGMNMFCDLRGRKEISHIYVDSDRGDLGFSLFSVLFIFSFFFWQLSLRKGDHMNFFLL